MVTGISIAPIRVLAPGLSVEEGDMIRRGITIPGASI